MNRSLLLVMCDVLVLSAMSLSDGGFDGDEKRMQGSRDVTAEYKATTAGLAAATNALEKTKNELVAAKNGEAIAKSEAEIAKANEKHAQDEAEAAKKGEALAKNEAEVAKANEQHARSEAEKAKEGQARAEKGRDDAERAAVAAEAERVRLLPDAEEFRRRNGNMYRSRSCAVQVVVDIDGDEEKYWSPLVELNGNFYVLGIYEKKILEKIRSVNVSIDYNSVSAVRGEYVELGKDANVVAFMVYGAFGNRAVRFAPPSYRRGNVKSIIIKKKAKDDTGSIEDGSITHQTETGIIDGTIEAVKTWMPIDVGDCIIDEEEAYIIRMRLSARRYVNFPRQTPVRIWSEYHKSL